jgi:protein-tyrosine phosphatase
MNVKDIGGDRLTGGGRVRTGLLFRISGGLVHEEEFDALDAAGLRVLIDLRGEHEDRTALEGWAQSRGVRYERRPIDMGNPLKMMEMVGERGLTEAAARSHLATLYRRIIDEFGHELAAAVSSVTAVQPVGFGCAAGKDRTGLLTALILDVLGVERSTIVAGYAAQAPDPAHLRELIGTWKQWDEGQLSQPGFGAIFGAAESVMAEALDYIDQRYGGSLAYLEGAGLPPGTADRLRDRISQPTSGIAPARL